MNLYTITNRLNGKVYVGATTLSMPRRLGCHRQDAKRGKTTLIAQAIREFGWDNFEVQAIGGADSLDELLRAEAEAMTHYHAIHPNGYNRSSFGSNAWRWFDDERERQSKRCLGRLPWNKGVPTGPMSAETKEKQRQAHLGQRAWNKDVPASIETRNKLSVLRMGGENPKAKAIEFEGKPYPSIADARRATGLTHMQMKYRLMKGIARYLD